MKFKKKLILIELNELNFDFVKKYSSKYNLKFFNNFFFEKIKISHSERVYDKLEPWIQWVSIHTGKTADEHKIFRLGDVKFKKISQVFEKVENLGFSVGAISPMNSVNNLSNANYFVSDPWSDGGEDKNFFHNRLAKTIARSVNSNSSGKIKTEDYLILILAVLFYGRIKNFFLFFNLFFRSFKKKWLKAIFLDLVLNEMHIKLLKKYNTDFSCIFFNAGAHIQHHYFFNSEFYEDKIENPSWYINKNFDPIKDAILFYDKILYEYSQKKDYEILIATGLSQVPYDRKKFYYRLSNHEKFLDICNIKYKKVLPRMTRDFVIEFDSEIECKLSEDKLSNINILNKKKIFDFDNRGSSLFVTLQISQEIKYSDVLLLTEDKKIILFEHVVFVALKNGMHHEKGYVYSSDRNIDIINSSLSHVKDLHDVIINFFKNKL